MNQNKINLIALILPAMMFLSSCATEVIGPSKYETDIEKSSAGDVEYAGFQNTFKFKATLMNEATQNIYNDKLFEIYKWDEQKRIEELKKLQSNNGKMTTVFISFFTPQRMDDNLANSKSIWKIYLQTSAGRFEGKAIRSKTSPTELYVLFPYHNRWATGYEVEFPVAITQIQSSEVTLTVTGPMGSKDVKIPAK